MKGLVCEAVSLSRMGTDGTRLELLREVSAQFPAGSLSLVAGETGAGKSSLLHVLGGLVRPSAGQVLADGEPVSRWLTEHRDLWRRRVGLVFQHANLVPDLTALENVLLPLVPRGGTLAEAREAGFDALRRLGVLEVAGKAAASLSGGERQRVSVARALVSPPDFLLADEPTAHQDAKSVVWVLEALRAAQASGAAVVVASHDPRLLGLEEVSQRLTLHRGCLEVDS